MTLDTLLLLIVTVYLALVAYGVAGARRRLAARARLVAMALTVLLPPALLAGALAAAGEDALVAAWWRLFAGMPLAGAVVAFAADRIARVAGQ